MSQDEAFALLRTGLNVFLTGEPGSGKTHTINRYVAWLRQRGIEPAVTASTGIAATHIGGMTIHSWSGIGVKRDVSEQDIELIMSKEKTARRIVDTKVLIIDEISMLDASTLESVDRVLRTLRRRPMMEEQPFGGLQVIFVGDFFQLPPVSKKEAARFAFQSLAWKEANPVVCYLNEQHRQEDKEFLELLTALRQGLFSQAHRARLRSRANVAPKQSHATRLYTHNEDVDRINQEALGKLSGQKRVYEMSTKGAKALVESLKTQCLSPEVLELKVGAKVLFTRNNFDVGYVNGTLGEVTGFSSLGEPIVKTASRTITVEPAEWVIQDGRTVLARLSQMPLRLAWAITVHKSQGMSLDTAIVDLSQAFEYGQGYVALSRVRTLQGLYLEGFNERALQLHPDVAHADRHFRAYSEAARHKFDSLPGGEKEKLEKNFLRAIGAKEAHSAAADGAGADFSRPAGLTYSRSDSPRSEKSAPAPSAELSKFNVLRQKHENAYKKWTKEDDEQLERMFRQKIPHKEIAKHFARNSGAIRSRLMHLGLIPDYWKNRRSSASA